MESRGYQVFEAGNGRLGLQEAVFHRPGVVLLDLGLPDMEGLEVLKNLREWSTVPVLVLSVRDQEDIKVAALENGADDYVTKPFSTAELVARPSGHLQRTGHRLPPARSGVMPKFFLVWNPCAARDCACGLAGLENKSCQLPECPYFAGRLRAVWLCWRALLDP